MCPRKYDSSRRRGAAEATRTQILQAARAIVGGKSDLDRFSMEAVARKAGVARMTVYYQFRSRADLLEALADHLANQGGMQRMRDVFVESNLEKAVRLLVDVFVDFWASDRTTLRRIRAMGVVAPAQSSGPRDRDAWRRSAVVNLLTRLRGPGSGPGSPPERLVDLLTSLTSFETYDGLADTVRDPARIASLLGDAAVELVRAWGRGGPAGAGPARRAVRPPRRNFRRGQSH